jgi:hypothetical protein
MATRAVDAVGRLALQRARVRMPELAPDSVEVVELVRGSAFVVVRTAPSGIVVLDERGRLVRGRDRLVAIARHVATLREVDGALREAQLELRLEHAVRSLSLLGELDLAKSACDVKRLLSDLDQFRVSLEALIDERLRAPATPRTLRRTVNLLNEAAVADRAVVRTVRAAAATIASASFSGRASPESTLRRWVLARLSNADLPFFLYELGECDRSRQVAEFVTAARS